MSNPSAAISPPRSASPRRQRLLRRAFVIVPSALVILATIGLLITVIAILSEPVDVTRSGPLPGWLERLSRHDSVAYPIHAALGTILNAVGGPPIGAGVQWYKAAAHARTADEVERAAQGITTARQRDPKGESVDATLCAPNVRRGARATQVAAMGQAGLPCGAAGEAEARLHVPDGTRVVDVSRPPTSGPHYGDWWRTYGLVDQALPAGVWLHNLEHGAVVLLYNCPSACPDLVSGRSGCMLASLPIRTVKSRARDCSSSRTPTSIGPSRSSLGIKSSSWMGSIPTRSSSSTARS